MVSKAARLALLLELAAGLSVAQRQQTDRLAGSGVSPELLPDRSCVALLLEAWDNTEAMS